MSALYQYLPKNTYFSIYFQVFDHFHFSISIQSSTPFWPAHACSLSSQKAFSFLCFGLLHFTLRHLRYEMHSNQFNTKYRCCRKQVLWLVGEVFRGGVLLLDAWRPLWPYCRPHAECEPWERRNAPDHFTSCWSYAAASRAQQLRFQRCLLARCKKTLLDDLTHKAV